MKKLHFEMMSTRESDLMWSDDSIHTGIMNSIILVSLLFEWF